MGVIDAKNAHARIDPEAHDIAEREPGARQCVGSIEIDVDDIFVFLRRIFREMDRAVGPPREPAFVLGEPGVIARALNRKIEGDLHAVFVRGKHERAKILRRAQIGMNRVVAPFR